MTSHRPHGIVIGTATVIALLLGAALAGKPSIEVEALGVRNGTIDGYLTARSTGDATDTCYQNTARKPSFGCFHTVLQESGLEGLLAGSSPVTVLAPTDEAFAHLASTIGAGAFRAFVHSPTATAAFVRASIVRGSYTLADLVYHSSSIAKATSVSTLGGTTLRVRFGTIGFGTDRTSVKVGPSGAIDGQSFLAARPLLFWGGNVLLPLGRVTQVSLAG